MGTTGYGLFGDYHELDIALLEPGVSGISQYDKVLMAVECKNTSSKKSIITAFDTWPADDRYGLEFELIKW